MKRFLTFLLLLPVFAWAQQPIWDWMPELRDSSNGAIALEGIFSLGSDGVHFGDLYRFFTDDYLDQNEKDALTSSLNSQNLYGGHNRIQYGHIYRSGENGSGRSSNLNGWSISYTQLNGFDFSDSLALIALYGNAPYAGREVRTGQLALQNISYSKLSYFWSKEDNKGGRWTISPAFVIGHQMQELRLDESSVHTHEDGDFLRVYYDGHAYGSDPDNTGVFAFNGTGLALDLAYAVTAADRHEFSIAFQDLGIIFWNSRSRQWTGKDTLDFEGLDIPNILDVGDSLFSQGIDSITDAHFKGEEGAFGRVMPALMLFRYSYQLDRGAWKSIDLLINHRFNGIQRPQLVMGAVFEFPAAPMADQSRHRLSPYAVYGGYNGFGLGVRYLLSLPKAWEIGFDISNAQSLVVPDRSYGLGVWLSLNYQLN
jgi:hypothetical protein